MKVFLFLFSSFLTSSLLAAPIVSKKDAIQQFNNIQNSYESCFINFNENKDYQWGSPEIKCTEPYNNQIIKLVRDIRAGSGKNATDWKSVNFKHIQMNNHCKTGTAIKSYNPTYFTNNYYICTASTYTSLAQSAILLSY